MRKVLLFLVVLVGLLVSVETTLTAEVGDEIPILKEGTLIISEAKEEINGVPDGIFAEVAYKLVKGDIPWHDMEEAKESSVLYSTFPFSFKHSLWTQRVQYNQTKKEWMKGERKVIYRLSESYFFTFFSFFFWGGFFALLLGINMKRGNSTVGTFFYTVAILLIGGISLLCPPVSRLGGATLLIVLLSAIIGVVFFVPAIDIDPDMEDDLFLALGLIFGAVNILFFLLADSFADKIYCAGYAVGLCVFAYLSAICGRWAVLKFKQKKNDEEKEISCCD